MNYRIIETTFKFPDILLHRDIDSDGEFVKIFAIGIMEGEENMYAIEKVRFERYETASTFIDDFSNRAAEQWCTTQGIKNW